MSETIEDRRRLVAGYIKKYLPELQEHQIAGAIGNLEHESAGLNSRINEGMIEGAPLGKGGYGYAQWTGGRQTNLVNFARSLKKDPGDPEAQVAFLASELRGPEKAAFQSLLKTKTPEEAAIAFNRDFERPGVPAYENRIKYANNAYATIASGKGYTNTSPTTDLSQPTQQSQQTQQKLNVDVKPYDFTNDLAQGLSSLKTPSATADIPSITGFGENSSDIPYDRATNSIRLDDTKLASGPEEVFGSLTGSKASATGRENASTLTATAMQAVQSSQAYLDKVNQLKNTLGEGGSPKDSASPSTYGNEATHEFVTGNSGRSTGPHLDVRAKRTDPKTGQVTYLDPSLYASRLLVGDKAVDRAFEMTAPWKQQRKGYVHEGADYATPVGTRLKVPKEWQYKGMLNPDQSGGGGWVKQYQDEQGNLVQLLHGSPIG